MAGWIVPCFFVVLMVQVTPARMAAKPKKPYHPVTYISPERRAYSLADEPLDDEGSGEPSSDCQAASENLGSILDILNEWVLLIIQNQPEKPGQPGKPGNGRPSQGKPTYGNPKTGKGRPFNEVNPLRMFYRQQSTPSEPEMDDPSGIRSYVYVQTGWDLYRSEDRERLLCSFEGVATLKQLMTALEKTEMAFLVTLLTYDTKVLEANREKARMLAALDRPDEKEEYKAFVSLKLDLLRRVEEAGLLGLDKFGVEMIKKAYEVIRSKPIVLPQTVPISQLPVKARCAQIADAVRKVWYALKQKYNSPEEVSDIKTLIKQWTGIEWSGHKEVLDMLCDLLDDVDEYKLRGLYTWLLERKVYEHLLQQGYPYIVQFVDDMQEVWDITLARPGADQDESAEIFRQADQLLDHLRNMNLLSLQDDFDF